LADEDDAWHRKATGFLKEFTGRLVIPFSVIPECCYLLNSYLGQEAELTFIQSLLRGELLVEQLTYQDMIRSRELMDQYRDSNIGFVDASIAAVAERHKFQEILTTDRRHFNIIRPKHCKSFTLLP
jgi:hypothetical protein